MVADLEMRVPNSAFCQSPLPITFANILDSDQARRHVGPDLDPNFFWHKGGFLERMFMKTLLEKNSKITQHAKS